MINEVEYFYQLSDEAMKMVGFSLFGKNGVRIGRRPRQRPWRCPAGGNHFYVASGTGQFTLTDKSMYERVAPRCEKCGWITKFKLGRSVRSYGFTTFKAEIQR